MNIKFKALILQCKQSREVINFSPQVSLFNGKTSAGKSSIVRLIDFCFGGDLELTPALKQELISVELIAQIGTNNVVLERQAQGSRKIQVTWQGDNDSGTVLAPIQSSSNQSPIWGTDVFYLSDLIFYLAGSPILKVRKNQTSQNSPLVRLSFRDILWYCYLDQDNLDSSFYRLEEPIILAKSRDVMRFLVGFYNEKLSQLETRLAETKKQKSGKKEAIIQKSKKFRPKGRGMENVLLANPWFPLQAYIFRPKGRGITPKLLLKYFWNNFAMLLKLILLMK